MELEIRRLTPDLVNDYVRFFDQTPHDDGLAEHRCYCLYWSPLDWREHSIDEFNTAEARRQRAFCFVKNSSVQGYLAYVGNKAVGWCNTNSKKRHAEIRWLALHSEV
jgi:hypothetical protein